MKVELMGFAACGDSRLMVQAQILTISIGVTWSGGGGTALTRPKVCQGVAPCGSRGGGVTFPDARESFVSKNRANIIFFHIFGQFG